MGKLVIKPKGVVHISYNGNGSGSGSSTLGDPVALKCYLDGKDSAFQYEVFERSKFSQGNYFPDTTAVKGHDRVTFGTFYPDNYDEGWDGYIDYPVVPGGCIVVVELLVPEDASEFEWEEFGVSLSGDEGGGGVEVVV